MYYTYEYKNKCLKLYKPKNVQLRLLESSWILSHVLILNHSLFCRILALLKSTNFICSMCLICLI